MAAYDFNTLKEKYNDFLEPVAEITANKKDFSKNKGGYIASDVIVPPFTAQTAGMPPQSPHIFLKGAA